VRLTQSEVTMAKPNYSFEKRQRELKKAKDKEEKRLKKLADKAAGVSSSDTDAAEDAAEDQDQAPADPT
jgi:hypothetical protein